MSWQRMGRPDRGQLEQLVAKIQPNDSMVEIERYLRELLDPDPGAAGNHAIALEGAERVVIWGGLSDEAAALLGALVVDERIVLVSADVARYGIAGRGMDLPILPPVPYEPLEREHWLPVVLYPARYAPRLPVVDLTEQGR